MVELNEPQPMPDLKCGEIYLIKNLINGRVYVGCAASAAARVANHVKELNGGRHQNKEWQRDWVEHGPSAFQWGIQERCETWEGVRAAEREWIDRCLDYGVNVYNDDPHTRLLHDPLLAKWSLLGVSVTTILTIRRTIVNVLNWNDHRLTLERRKFIGERMLT